MSSTINSGPRRWYVIAAPYLWLLLFFLVPFFIVFKLSLSDTAISIPPYTPTFSWQGISEFISKLDFDNYTFIFSDPLYINAYWSSLQDRRRLDVPDVAHRLPDRIRHGARSEIMAADTDDAGHPAVLDVLPDPHLRLDRHPEERRAAQSVPDELGHHQRAFEHPEHDDGRLHRHRLFVPAVHDPASLCEP